MSAVLPAVNPGDELRRDDKSATVETIENGEVVDEYGVARDKSEVQFLIARGDIERIPEGSS